MTTHEELKKIIEKHETEFVELKPKSYLNDKDEFIKQAISFTNKKGGKYIIGVKDDGTIDGYTNVNWDKAINKFNSVAHDKCSPPIDFIHEVVDCKNDGEVLILHINKRRDMPHAIVKKDTNGNIKKRIYYIRKTNGNRLVTDMELNWLFKHQDDPDFFSEIPFCILYDLKSGGVPDFIDYGFMSYTPWTEMQKSLQSLTEEQRCKLVQDASNRELLELLPYLVLNYLSQTYMHTWTMKKSVSLGGGLRTGKANELGQSKITITDVPMPPDGGLLTSLMPEFRNKFLEKCFLGLSLPPDTSLEISSTDSPYESMLRMTNSEFFKIDIKFRPIYSVRSLPHGFPLNSIISRNRYWTSTFNMVFDAHFEFPEYDFPNFDRFYEWAKQMNNFLIDDFDWNIYLKKLPEQNIFSIDMKVKEILRRMNHE